MKLICKHCKKEIERDMRFLSNKQFMTKRGYKSYCENKNKRTYLQTITSNKLKTL